MSDLAMANVEALADNESIYDYRYPKTIACDLQEGPWHTASVERICVFSATPSTCTPVACGRTFLVDKRFSNLKELYLKDF